MCEEVYIIAGCRTAVGSLMGQFSKFPASELGTVVIKNCLDKAKIGPNDIDQVIMGQTLTAGQGQNPARQAAMNADVPDTVPAFTVNMLCGSGLKAVYLAWQSVAIGEAHIVIAGGQESMSQAHHSILLRGGVRYGNVQMVDTLLCDGLTDAFHKVHMGLTAEHLADVYNVSRTEQDQFACESQAKAQKAMEAHWFDSEIVPVFDKNKSVGIMKDEFPKANTTVEKLALLKPAFKDGGTVTAGNASGINDGAAALVLAGKNVVKQKNLKPIAKILGFSECGVNPMKMGLGPVNAIQSLLQKINWSVKDVDLFELNEAFAAQSVVCMKTLGLDKHKVNVSGGAIALGHPIGASGARVLVTLIYNLMRQSKKKGIAALCVGGGMGIAVAVELCD